MPCASRTLQSLRCAISVIAIFGVVSRSRADMQCVPTPPVNAAAIAQFDADPSAYLSTIAPGGALVGAVRNLAVSDPGTAGKIVAFARITPAAAADIGTGLGQAAKICQARAPGLAQQLQQAVRDDPGILALFQPVLGDAAAAPTSDSQTAFATPGGSSGGGGAGIGGSSVFTGARLPFPAPATSALTRGGTFSFESGGVAGGLTRAMTGHPALTTAIGQATARISP